jgi:hypothetical protein
MKFYAVGSFHVPSRRLFVLVGDFTEGEARDGMTLSLQLNPSFGVKTGVRAVEVIRGAHLGREYRGLVLDYEDPAELGFWDAMDISDEELELQ